MTHAITSLVLGVIGLVAWSLMPLFGVSITLIEEIIGISIAITLIGLIIGIRGMKKSHRKLSIVGTIICLIVFLFSVASGVKYFLYPLSPPPPP